MAAYRRILCVSVNNCDNLVTKVQLPIFRLNQAFIYFAKYNQHNHNRNQHAPSFGSRSSNFSTLLTQSTRCRYSHSIFTTRRYFNTLSNENSENITTFNDTNSNNDNNNPHNAHNVVIDSHIVEDMNTNNSDKNSQNTTVFNNANNFTSNNNNKSNNNSTPQSIHDTAMDAQKVDNSQNTPNTVIDSPIFEDVNMNKEEKEGNESFLQEDFNGAISLYSQAISAYTEIIDICRVTFLRAQSYKKLGEFGHAYQDYVSCIRYYEKFKSSNNNIINVDNMTESDKKEFEQRAKLEYEWDLLVVNSFSGIGFMFLDNPSLPRELNMKLDNITLAHNFFDKGLEVGNYVDLLYGRGLCYVKTRHFEEAKLDFITLLQLDNKFSPGYHGRGDANLGMGNYIDALNDFQDFLESYPHYHQTFSAKTSQSLLDPDRIVRDVRLKRGICSYHLQDYPNAYTELCKLIDLDNENALAYYYRGKVQLARKNYTSAIGDFTNAIDYNPNISGAYLSRSEANQKIGNMEASLRDKEAHLKLLEKKKIFFDSLPNIAKG